MNRTVILSIGISVWLLASAPVPAQDAGFYEAQLRLGRSALAAKRAPEAIDHLRIAAFGLLDRPPLLSEALARLALAYEAARDTEKLGATIERLVRVEERFAGLQSAALEPETRAALRRLLEARVPRAKLAAIPSLAPAAVRPTPARSTGSSGPTPPAPRPPTPVASRSEIREAPAVYESPRYRPTVKPQYPVAALRDRVGGIVLLRVLVSESGQPLEIEVVREIRPDLSAAAVGAVRRWDFEPARRNGVPVAAWTTVPIPFRP